MKLAGRRGVLVWMGLPVVLALGAGGAYLAVDRADHSAGPAATTAHNQHGGHVMPDGTTMTDGASRAASHDMGGMDMSGSDMNGMDMGGSDMDGMDMGGQSGHDGTGGHSSDDGTTPSRPRAAVLGTFGAANGAVLLSAALLRRRARTRGRARPAR